MPHKNGFGKKGIKNLHMTQWVYYRKHNDKESNAMLSECEVGGGGEYSCYRRPGDELKHMSAFSSIGCLRGGWIFCRYSSGARESVLSSEEPELPGPRRICRG